MLLLVLLCELGHINYLLQWYRTLRLLTPILHRWARLVLYNKRFY